jgi:hypothetical protein
MISPRLSHYIEIKPVEVPKRKSERRMFWVAWLMFYISPTLRLFCRAKPYIPEGYIHFGHSTLVRGMHGE